MPDSDWGSDTLARFRYQAEVTLPYCLSALLYENDIRAVVAEHLEDIALETTTGWRFLQVKSRNPERGLWKASDLLAKKGGALRSLYRTYLLTKGEDHSLELVLEGALKTNDLIMALRPQQDRTPLLPVVMEKLDATKESAEDFLRRVTLNESASHRTTIHATNARLLHVHAPSLTLPELEALHSSLLHEIENAMRCEPFGALWPQSVVHPEERSPLTEQRLQAKTLDANRMPKIVELLSSAERPLLKRLVQSGSTPFSSLTQKLIVGGATPALIERARNLQANAQHHRLLRAATSVSMVDAQLTDLHERIGTYVDTAAAIHASSPNPAIGMWDNLLERFSSHAAKIDQNNLLRADPMLLMGESCILSDQCVFDWGGQSYVVE
ncbi:MAG: dsDNA nuclease domain-containing protein [Rhodospirillaceae bacterium]|nr:dsDNA nuclease domain-containing protein [Rhodospirillaceae bacterium]